MLQCQDSCDSKYFHKVTSNRRNRRAVDVITGDLFDNLWKLSPFPMQANIQPTSPHNHKFAFYQNYDEISAKSLRL